MKLSIVIPVYNVENTLRRCLDSVISQSYHDWQMILVDDASTDDSLNICKEYSKDNGHIQLIHLEKNSGLSVARNKGIGKAKGDYITFIDSDDYIAPNTLKELMEVIAIHPDYDILEYPVYEHFGGKGQRLLQFYKKEYSDMKVYWLAAKAYQHTYAWNKIYKRELFRGISYPSGKTFEDAWTLPQLLKKCNIVATTDAGLYYYCDNKKGLTRQATAEDLQSLLEANLSTINLLSSSKEKLSKELDKDFGDYYSAVLNILLDVTDRDGKVADFPILPYKHTLKLKLLHIIGLNNLCRIHRLFRHSH